METIGFNKKQASKGSKARKTVVDDTKVIGAHADYRREDFVFPRTQSLTMRDMEWADRIKPMRPRVPNFVANLAFALFAA